MNVQAMIVTATKRNVRSLWEAYKKAPTTALRNQLVEQYLHLVRYNAERIHKKLPHVVELDDLVSAGVFGLMDAIDAFDIDRGVKFETFCPIRIRGAILDELRFMDWVPRLTRHRSNMIATTRSQLENELGRAPTDEEIRKRLNISEAEYDKIISDAESPETQSLSTKLFDTDSGKEQQNIDRIHNDKIVDPSRIVMAADLREMILKSLGEDEQIVLELIEFEDYTMKKAGEFMFLSESRISQMHTSIRNQLKSRESLKRLV
jgi:RNA polymerase sigma factor for flagellar operon FliA